MLLLEGVALTDSGRPVLAPEELELRILEKTDAEFGERRGGLVSAPDERYRGGIAFLTTHRLIWLDQPALPSPGRSCSLHLSRVTSASPVPLKMFGSRTKRHALRCSANGGLGPSDEAGELRLAFRGESPESFARCLDDALANRAWRNEHDPPNSNQSTPNRKTTQTQTRNERGVPSFPRGRSAYDAAASRSAPPPPPPPPPLGPSADQRATAAAAERDRMTSATRARHAGVGGALHRQKQEAEKDERVLGRAFTDMSEVMRRAGELVALAERFATATARKSEKTVGSDPSNEERKTSENDAASMEMREMLVSLGIASPVTKASAGALYHRQLSRQLADWLPQALAQNGGILALPDVFCLFNRARGAELVSPEDVLKACQLWQSLGIKNVQFRRFDSGTLVAHAADRSDDEVCAALMSATHRGPRGDDASSQNENENETVASRMDAFAASEALGVPPAIAREYLAMAEGHGILCRDEGPDTTWFYPNKFAEFSAVEPRVG
jgi:ESCRT-II complex subunit VPS36